MNYFLDTNICIYFLKGTYPHIVQTIKKHEPGKIKIPSIVKAELLLGAYKSKTPKKNREIIYRFLKPYEIIGFDANTAELYAEIRGILETKGKIIGPNDLIIAACVLAANATLITNNTKEFSRVPNLLIENWT